MADTYHVTRKGYRRNNRTGKFEHVEVWERAHGPVPAGHVVHHVDEDKQHNELSNLRLLTHLEHKRLHAGDELRDGVWWKRCRTCGEFKPIDRDHWYYTGEWPHPPCRTCRIADAVARKQRVREVRNASA